MIPAIFRTVEIIAILGTVCSCLYYSLCLWVAAKFLRAQRSAPHNTEEFLPPVSILKPLKGTDPEMYESFRSHCVQDYPEYEIIFGVSEAGDPAVDNVRRLQNEFPERKIKLIVCSRMLGTNVKVSNLAQMLEAASYDYLIVNDSDIRIEPDYLRRVIAPLAEPNVGMVTCPYRGVAATTLGSRLESLGISTDFFPGVLAANELEGGIRFGLGSTLAFRRTELEKIGGFEPIVDYLADDYELGKRIADLGSTVILSDVIVETFLPAYRFRDFLAHQLRWARGVRDARFAGYVGLVFTFGFFWALVALIASKGALWAWAAVFITLMFRLAVAWLVGRRVLRDRAIAKHFWLIPVRDLIAVGVWIASFVGHTVSWRGDRFHLKNGRLTRIAP